MGRPSKLSERRWDDLGHRLLYGEHAADLAREFGVSKSAVSFRFSELHRTIRSVAHRLINAEDQLRALAPAEQLAALRLAEYLRIQAAAESLASQSIVPQFLRRSGD